MTEPAVPSVRAALRSAIISALKQRDRAAAALYRSALGAIDNASAIPASSAHRAGAIESSAVGVGRADVQRRELSERDMVEIVVGEADERRAAAELLEPARPEAAEQLRAEARLLLALLRGLAPG
jgi:uncharacterized protein